MFVNSQDLMPGLLPPDRLEFAQAVAAGLPDSEVLEIERRIVKLAIAGLDEPVTGDVSRSGFTVYLGGFDWVTYPTPPFLLAKFPDLMPLPQQVFSPPAEDDVAEPSTDHL